MCFLPTEAERIDPLLAIPSQPHHHYPPLSSSSHRPTHTHQLTIILILLSFLSTTTYKIHLSRLRVVEDDGEGKQKENKKETRFLLSISLYFSLRNNRWIIVDSAIARKLCSYCPSSSYCIDVLRDDTDGTLDST